MNDLATKQSLVVPSPKFEITTRKATDADIPFIDRLQKMHSKSVGFMFEETLRGKIRAGHILIAEATKGLRDKATKGNADVVLSSPSVAPSLCPSVALPVGYIMGNDQYFKRDDVGIIYQMNIVPEYQRGYDASALLKAQFEQSAYGCKLYCCWCLKHLDHANKFWENMGFVPLAFRAGGSSKKDHIHIFWQKRIREGDTTTPYWYPSKTDQGAMREDRVVLPIPPGTHWSDVHAPEFVTESAIANCEGASNLANSLAPSRSSSSTPRKPRDKKKPAPVVDKFDISAGGFRIGPVVPSPVAQEKPQRAKSCEPKPKVKLDPKIKEAAREMRDRWLEKVNDGTFVLESAGKYNVARALPDSPRSAIGVQSDGQRTSALPAAA